MNTRLLRKKYEDLLKAEANAARQQDYYKFEYKFIQDLGLYAGEDEELQERLAMMKNSSRIFQSVRSSYDLLQGTGYDGGPSLLDDLGRAASELSEIGTYSEQISSWPLRHMTRITRSKISHPVSEILLSP